MITMMLLGVSMVLLYGVARWLLWCCYGGCYGDVVV